MVTAPVVVRIYEVAEEPISIWGEPIRRVKSIAAPLDQLKVSTGKTVAVVAGMVPVVENRCVDKSLPDGVTVAPSVSETYPDADV